MKKTFLLLIMIVAFAITAYSASAALTDGLTNYYTFNGNANNYYGTCNGTVTNAPNVNGGIIPPSYYYDGDDYITYADTCVQAQQQGTISFWINGTVPGDDTDYIVGYRDESNGDYFLLIWYAGGVIKINTKISVYAYSLSFPVGNTFNGTPHHIVFTSNGSKIAGYLDGVYQSLTVITGANGGEWFADVSTTAAFTTGTQINPGPPTPQEMVDNANIDEFGLWNRSLSDTEVLGLYRNGTIGRTPFNTTDTPTAPTQRITFYNQTPADIVTTTLFATDVSVFYNITNSSNLDKVWLNYSFIDAAVSGCVQFLNGSCSYQNGTLQTKTGTNTSTMYKFVLGENDLLPSTSNLNYATINTSHSTQTFGGTSQYLSVEFLNVSSTSNYNIFEFMINNSATGAPIQIYYCNESYSFTTNPSTSTSCSFFNSLAAGTSYNHTHGTFSSHQTVSLPIVAGRVGSVGVTSKSYFLFRTISPTINANAYYVPTVARTGVTKLTINNGATWSNVAGTLDSHLHQFDTNDKVTYRGCANTTSGDVNCTSYTTDTYEQTILPPSSPVVTSPSGDVSTFVSINYSAAIPTSGSILFYNISLLNSDFTFNKTVVSNNSNAIGYLYDTVTNNVSIGNYYVKVKATDSNGFTSEGISDLFNVTYNARLNISAKSNLSGSSISGFSLTVYDSTLDTTREINTTTTYAWVDVVVGNFVNVEIDTTGYEVKDANFTIASGITVYNFNLYTTNSISFTFKDELTSTTLNGTTVEFELISSIFSANYTTANGTYYLDLLSPATYTIRYSATGYDERTYYFTLTNRTHNELTLYLLNTSYTTQVTATVYNTDGRTVEGAVIKVLKYDIATNSYVLREMQTSNFEGEAVLNLVLGSEYYEFIIEYPSGTVRLTTSPSYIYQTTISFQISEADVGGESYINSYDVLHSLYADNSTRGFYYSFNDLNGLVTQGCLKIYEYASNGITLRNTSCVSAASGDITLYVSNATGKSYIGKAFIYYSGEEIFIDSVSYVRPNARDLGNIGLLLTALVSITIVILMRDNISMMPIFAVLPFVFSSFMGFISVPVLYLIPVLIISVIISAIVTRR